MARTSAAAAIRLAASKIVLEVTSTKAYADRINAEAEKVSSELTVVAEDYYLQALSNMAVIAESGRGPANQAVRSLRMDDPYGKVLNVTLTGNSLTVDWLRDKRKRASESYKRPVNKRTGKPIRRGRSLGPDRFWLDEGKLGAALERYFKDAQAEVTLSPKIKARRGGLKEITFRIELKRLPSGFLDVAIRRSLLQGAGGPDRATAFLEFSDGHKPKSGNPQGVVRGYGPERLRPTMRPIAQRLGRALKKQLIKTINRR